MEMFDNRQRRTGLLEQREQQAHGLLDFLVGIENEAAGRVEDQADAQRQIFHIKVFDFLFDSVFRQPEVAAVETGDKAAIRIGYGRIHQDEIDIDFERLVLGFRHSPGA